MNGVVGTNNYFANSGGYLHARQAPSEWLFVDVRMTSGVSRVETVYNLSVSVRGIEVETSEVLWSGNAFYPEPINNPEAGVVYLTEDALERAWCPPGLWRDREYVWEKEGCVKEGDGNL